MPAFNYPAGLAVDATGFLYVADTGNNTIRQGALTTNGAPIIVTQPQDLGVNPGNDATFTVGALGQMPLAYQWRFNQADIPGATNRSYTLINVGSGDLGSYSVLVTNQFGSATSAVALLTLNTPPSIATQPKNQTVLPGQSATFTVVAEGTAPLSYQWQFNGSAIQGATDSFYTLPSAQRPDAGAYSVLVMNPGGAVLSADALLSFVPLDAWGDNTWGQLDFTAAAHDVIAIASGAWHNLALAGRWRRRGVGQRFGRPM